MIDFSGKSTRRRLFYAIMFGNTIHCNFTLKSFVKLHSLLWFQVFLFNTNNSYVDQFNHTLTGTITLSQSETESNGNEGVFDTPLISRTGALPSDTV